MASSQHLDAFEYWCLCHIVHIPYTAHITNEEVRHSHLSYRKETTSSVRTSCESRPITRPLVHPSSSHQSSASGLATPGMSTKADMVPYIELHLQPHNLGLNTAWMQRQQRSIGRHLQLSVRRIVQNSVSLRRWLLADGCTTR